MGDLNINIPTGAGIGFSNFKRKSNTATLNEKVENLENFLLRNMTKKSFYLLFDELDEDYKNIQETYGNSEYLDLLTSLFKAVQDIRGIFKKKDLALYPVVLLRDDIYDLIHDADKTKWRDLSVPLNWSIGEIKFLIKYRLNLSLIHI